MDYFNQENWHEASKLFPLMQDEEFQDLVNDIKENGLLSPIMLFENKILDGRNRLLACKELGIDPKFSEWNALSDVSPILWTISMNLKRRNLSPSQKAMIAVEAKPILEAEAKKHQQEHGNTSPGKPKNTFVKNDKSDSKPMHVRKAVAKQIGVSEGYVYEAQKIKDKDESIAQKVKSGELSIPDAQKELGFKQNTKAMVSSDSNEWYTPKNYIDVVRTVLENIDLDPASSELSNKYIKANKFYTVEDDGLKHDWIGKIFLNPPYGDTGPKFVNKLLDEFEAGHVTEAIVLLNSHVTDSKWFKPLFDHILCFTNHRSKFWNKNGTGDAPTHGSVFVYLGDNWNKFSKNFQSLGSVVSKYFETT